MSDPPIQRDQLRDLLAEANREAGKAEAVLHGLRKSYKGGCRCLPCRAAEATYQRELYRARAKGVTPLGRKVPAAVVKRHVRSMQALDLPAVRMARQGHLHRHTLRLDHEHVTLRTHLAVCRLWRWYCGDA